MQAPPSVVKGGAVEALARTKLRRTPAAGRSRSSIHILANGKYAEGEATLCLKIDMKFPNLFEGDPEVYRILRSHYFHVGDKWCVYPSQDYTHCIVDSPDWGTHSLCTLEFEIRRDSSHWVLEGLYMYRPLILESARLDLQHTVMSKRNLKQLVEINIVRG